MTTDQDQTRAHRGRLVGGAAIGLAASFLVQNLVLGAGAPTYASPMTEVLAYHASNQVLVGIAIGLEALNLPLMLVFLAGLYGLVQRRSGAGALWSRVAMVSGATAMAVFALYAVLWVGVVLASARLSAPTEALQITWQMHAAALALAFPALGTTLIGAGLAAHRAGLTPSWQRLLAVVGGALLIIAGSASLAIADGSPMLFVGMPGYAAWAIWLLVTGVRLVRNRSRQS